jgi:hypothetical protein
MAARKTAKKNGPKKNGGADAAFERGCLVGYLHCCKDVMGVMDASSVHQNVMGFITPVIDRSKAYEAAVAAENAKAEGADA